METSSVISRHGLLHPEPSSPTFKAPQNLPTPFFPSPFSPADTGLNVFYGLVMHAGESESVSRTVCDVTVLGYPSTPDRERISLYTLHSTCYHGNHNNSTATSTTLFSSSSRSFYLPSLGIHLLYLSLLLRQFIVLASFFLSSQFNSLFATFDFHRAAFCVVTFSSNVGDPVLLIKSKWHI